MKYYSELAQLGIFTIDDLVKISGSKFNAEKAISSMMKNGEIRRIKRNLYTAVNASTKEDFSNKYIIASNITKTSFVSYHSAFEFYGFYNQVFYDVQVSSVKRFQNFVYGEYSYSCFETNCLTQVVEIQDCKVTTLERTIVDSINMLGKVMDVEEIIKCLDVIHNVDEEKIKEMLLIYDKDILYRKVGYVLSFFKNQLGLNDSFFQFCKNHSNCKNIGFLSFDELNKLDFVNEWGLYGYKNLKNIIGKGGEIDV